MPRLVGADPGGLPRLVSRAQALQAGLTSDQIRHRVRSGRWACVSHGMYLREPHAAHPAEHQAGAYAHLTKAFAAQRRISGSALMLGSAALALDLPLVSGVPELVELAVPSRSWAGMRSGVRRRHQPIVPTDLDSRQPCVTSPERTWMDVARLLSGPDALSVGDAALRAGLVTSFQLAQRLELMGNVRGHKRARQALAHLSPLRESPLESLSWYRFVQWGIPLPLMQEAFYDERGLVGRVDFWWPDVRVVGEADGLLKYASWDVVVAEKRREDRLRRLGVRVVRWTWSDLMGDSARFRRYLEGVLDRRC